MVTCPVARPRMSVLRLPHLLRQHGQDRDRVTDTERDVFDAFFLVRRAGISRGAFMRQLTELCTAVLRDIAEHPLRRWDTRVARFQHGAPRS